MLTGVGMAALMLNSTPMAAQGRSAAAGSTKPWSLRMSESVMKRSPVVHQRWDYTAGLVLMAIRQTGESQRDRRLVDFVTTNMDRLVKPDGSIDTYRTDEFNLDQINQGRLLFPMMVGAKDGRYRKAADLLREQLRKQPRVAEGGFWHKKIYPQQMWLDGLYMAEPFYAQYAQVTGEASAFDDVAKQFLLAARYTRDVRTGLLHHAWDASHTQRWSDTTTGRSLHAWGRGAGWYMMALVDVLDYLPAKHPARSALIAVLQESADAIAAVQDPLTGLWFQVMDQPGRSGNYLEASGSAMFTYAFAKGARMGYLEPRYRGIAERGFNGLVSTLISVDADGTVSLNGICSVAGLGGNPYRDGSYDYYIHEPVVANDYKGVGPFILAALELKR
ncbi:MAG: glycoside hydrolase family 88 protein [Gemmatimonadaceae bacterium]